MSNFERIFAERKDHKNFDLKIWSEIYNLRRPFAYIPDIKLRQRLADIEKNIQYLDESKMWDDAQEAEYGWQSPWWWFRAYQFTLWECERRGIKPDSPLEIRRQTRYHYDYARKRKLTAIRVARLDWLADLLDGKVRFGAAASYNDPRLPLAQQDNEISRDMFLPNSSITLKTERETKSSFASPIRAGTHNQ